MKPKKVFVITPRNWGIDVTVDNKHYYPRISNASVSRLGRVISSHTITNRMSGEMIVTREEKK